MDNFTPKVVITVDTEPDNMWALNSSQRPQFKNISELSKLQKLFDKFRVKPTYLVTFSVINSNAVSVLKDIAESLNCEVGTHLHAMETPPFKMPLKGDGSYLQHYSPDIQEEKMAALDSLISDTFGSKPVSYRGGRWSFDETAIFILSKYGYLVDTSVTPGISWENYAGPNFKKSTCKDYFICVEGNGDILEVPASTVIKSKAKRLAELLYFNTPNWTRVEGALRRLAGFDILWLDPSFNSFEEMKWASAVLLSGGVRHLNISFHSSAIIPGGTPYTMSEKSTGVFFNNLESLLDYLLNDKKLEVLTLKEFYKSYKSN